MNDSTQVSINGDRVVLAFGGHFDVRYGKDDRVLRDTRLDSRAANGDLVFDVPNGTGKIRVRPSTIDSIVGSGVVVTPSVIAPRSPGETASDYLRRIERGLGSGQYARWIGTDPGQRALEDAAKEDKIARRTAKELDEPAKPPKPGRAKPAILAETRDQQIDRENAEKPKTAGRPYSERNQVWKCGTCKSRTRKPVCTGPADAPHDPVSAPSGKRRDDRG